MCRASHLRRRPAHDLPVACSCHAVRARRACGYCLARAAYAPATRASSHLMGCVGAHWWVPASPHVLRALQLAKMIGFVHPVAAAWTILKCHRQRSVDVLHITQHTSSELPLPSHAIPRSSPARSCFTCLSRHLPPQLCLLPFAPASAAVASTALDGNSTMVVKVQFHGGRYRKGEFGELVGRLDVGMTARVWGV